MNYQNNLSIATYYFYCMTIVVTLTLLPVWIGLLILTVILFYIRTDSIFIFLIAFLVALLSAIFISSINIAGDIQNYNEIFNNVYIPQYVNEFTYEPFLIAFYRLLKLTGASFQDVLFIQSLIMNLLLLYAMIKSFGKKGVKYYPLILIYPQFIQLSLYLSRQSWAVVFIIASLALLESKKLHLLKKFLFLACAIAAHSISLLYILLQYIAKFFRKRVGWKILLIIWVLSFILPVTIELVQKTFSGLFSYSSLIDRKIGYYLSTVNSSDNNSTLSIFSISMIPLHVIFLMNLFKMYKGKVVNEKNTVILFFIIIYLTVLLTINYPLLPGRIGLVILMFSPYFYFYTVHNFYEKTNVKNILNSCALILIVIVFIRFLYTNDFGDYNVKLANGNLLSLSVIDIFDY